MTIDQVAKALGVSKSTVSRALSGKGRIGDETRERICAYAEANGFIHPPGEIKNKVQTGNIGVVIPSDAYTTNIPFFQECLLGICEVAVLQEFNVLVTTRTEYDISALKKLVEKKKVDGIILTRSLEEDRAVKYLTEIGFPVGMTGTCQNDKVIQVDCDNSGAAKSLTSMLVGQGYRHFALILGNLSYIVNRCRYEGFAGALRESGIPAEKQVVYSGFEKMEFIDNMVSEIIARRVECVICGDDAICTKIVSKLQGDGYRIPMDISVASFYNSINLNCFSPSITTVHISAREIGNTIGRQMINYLKGNEYEHRQILDYELLYRKSTQKNYGR